MIKTKTAEQRELKRSKRLQKKLGLGEFKENFYAVAAKIPKPSNLEQKGFEDYMESFIDELTLHVSEHGGLISVSVEMVSIDGEYFLNLDGGISLPASLGDQAVIDLFSAYIEKSAEFFISEGKDNNYDPIWDEDDCFNTENWKAIFTK